MPIEYKKFVEKLSSINLCKNKEWKNEKNETKKKNSRMNILFNINVDFSFGPILIS